MQYNNCVIHKNIFLEVDFVRKLMGVLLLTLIICLLVGCAEEKASPAEDFKYYIEDNEITITGYTGDDSEVYIPSEIAGYKVTGLGWSAFEDCNTIMSVSIPESVVNFDSVVFVRCEKLITVIFPSHMDIEEAKGQIGSSCYNCVDIKIR